MRLAYRAAERPKMPAEADTPGVGAVCQFPTAESVRKPPESRHAGALDQAHEAFQRLAHSVRGSWPAENLLAFGQTTRVLLVVSAVHGEGTSTIARNLAACLAEGDRSRVVLVDANLRTPSQHRVLGGLRHQGLTDVVGGQVGLDRVMHNGLRSDLALLSCGLLVDDPPSVLAAAETANLFEELGSRFDWVVVDGPPATIYADATILARLSDAAILVVKAEATRYEVVEQAKRTLDECGVRILGAVLNRRRYHVPNWVYRRLG